ncbi:MAG: hypothetical protein P1U34_03040 [Coxiellaceae bacterium]|nr:hypothetical protein [Coxiellaceae bacterium]
MISRLHLTRLVIRLLDEAKPPQRPALEALSAQLSAGTDTHRIMSGLDEMHQHFKLTTLYQLASQNNTAVKALLKTLADQTEQAHPEFKINATPPTTQIIPTDLVRFHNSCGHVQAVPSDQLSQSRRLVRVFKDRAFVTAIPLEGFRAIDWRTGGDAAEDTLSRSHRAQRHISQLINSANADNTLMVDQLEALRSSNEAKAPKYLRKTLTGLANHYPEHNIIGIALQRGHIRLTQRIMCHIHRCKPFQVGNAIKNCYAHILANNDINALVMLCNLIADNNEKVLILARIMYYRHPDNAQCALAYQKRLKKIGRYRCTEAQRKEIYALSKAAHNLGNDEGTYQYATRATHVTKGIRAAFNMAITILRDDSYSDALKMRIFSFLLKHEKYVMHYSDCYSYLAECYQQGYGCVANLEKTTVYRTIAAELGDVDAFNACFPEIVTADELFDKAKKGFAAAVKRLHALTELETTHIDIKVTALNYLIICYSHEYGCRSNALKIVQYQQALEALAAHSVAPVSRAPLSAVHTKQITHRYHLRELTHSTDGSRRDMRHSSTRFFMMALGASDKCFTLNHMAARSSGYRETKAVIDFADLTDEYTATLASDTEKARWQRAIDDLAWSHNYLTDRTIAHTDTSLLERLNSGHMININASWYSWDDGSHSYHLAFFKFRGELYMIKSNRGGRRETDPSGLTFYRVANSTCLTSKQALEDLIKQCKDRPFCEGMESDTENTLGHALGLTKIADGQCNKSDQKGGTCALAAIQNAYLSHHIMQELQNDAASPQLTATDITRAFTRANILYKPWRAAMRILSMEKLTELAMPNNPLHITPSQHLTIMTHALKYVGKKQRRKRREKHRAFTTTTKGQLFAAVTPLLGPRSLYTLEQKAQLSEALKEARARSTARCAIS